MTAQAYIHNRAAEHKRREARDRRVKAQLIRAHGELIGLIMYRAYLERTYPPVKGI